ncbi:unnamed protein product [Amoebophrya sp. A120]|nr:unnamed protein product [Amoebophrya sp. A120]|eukprot:GSA120T00021209001.1
MPGNKRRAKNTTKMVPATSGPNAAVSGPANGAMLPTPSSSSSATSSTRVNNSVVVAPGGPGSTAAAPPLATSREEQASRSGGTTSTTARQQVVAPPAASASRTPTPGQPSSTTRNQTSSQTTGTTTTALAAPAPAAPVFHLNDQATKDHLVELFRDTAARISLGQDLPKHLDQATAALLATFCPAEALSAAQKIASAVVARASEIEKEREAKDNNANENEQNLRGDITATAPASNSVGQAGSGTSATSTPSTASAGGTLNATRTRERAPAAAASAAARLAAGGGAGPATGAASSTVQNTVAPTRNNSNRPRTQLQLPADSNQLHVQLPKTSTPTAGPGTPSAIISAFTSSTRRRLAGAAPTTAQTQGPTRRRGAGDSSSINTGSTTTPNGNEAATGPRSNTPATSATATSQQTSAFPPPGGSPGSSSATNNSLTTTENTTNRSELEQVPSLREAQQLPVVARTTEGEDLSTPDAVRRSPRVGRLAARRQEFELGSHRQEQPGITSTLRPRARTTDDIPWASLAEQAMRFQEDLSNCSSGLALPPGEDPNLVNYYTREYVGAKLLTQPTIRQNNGSSYVDTSGEPLDWSTCVFEDDRGAMAERETAERRMMNNNLQASGRGREEGQTQTRRRPRGHQTQEEINLAWTKAFYDYYDANRDRIVNGSFECKNPPAIEKLFEEKAEENDGENKDKCDDQVQVQQVDGENAANSGAAPSSPSTEREQVDVEDNGGKSVDNEGSTRSPTSTEGGDKDKDKQDEVREPRPAPPPRRRRPVPRLPFGTAYASFVIGKQAIEEEYAELGTVRGMKVEEYNKTTDSYTILSKIFPSEVLISDNKPENFKTGLNRFRARLGLSAGVWAISMRGKQFKLVRNPAEVVKIRKEVISLREQEQKQQKENQNENQNQNANLNQQNNEGSSNIESTTATGTSTRAGTRLLSVEEFCNVEGEEKTEGRSTSRGTTTTTPGDNNKNLQPGENETSGRAPPTTHTSAGAAAGTASAQRDGVETTAGEQPVSGGPERTAPSSSSSSPASEDRTKNEETSTPPKIDCVSIRVEPGDGTGFDFWVNMPPPDSYTKGDVLSLQPLNKDGKEVGPAGAPVNFNVHESECGTGLSVSLDEKDFFRLMELRHKFGVETIVAPDSCSTSARASSSSSTILNGEKETAAGTGTGRVSVSSSSSSSSSAANTNGPRGARPPERPVEQQQPQQQLPSLLTTASDEGNSRDISKSTEIKDHQEQETCREQEHHADGEERTSRPREQRTSNDPPTLMRERPSLEQVRPVVLPPLAEDHMFVDIDEEEMSEILTKMPRQPDLTSRTSSLQRQEQDNNLHTATAGSGSSLHQENGASTNTNTSTTTLDPNSPDTVVFATVRDATGRTFDLICHKDELKEDEPATLVSGEGEQEQVEDAPGEQNNMKDDEPEEQAQVEEVVQQEGHLREEVEEEEAQQEEAQQEDDANEVQHSCAPASEAEGTMVSGPLSRHDDRVLAIVRVMTETLVKVAARQEELAADKELPGQIATTAGSHQHEGAENSPSTAALDGLPDAKGVQEEVEQQEVLLQEAPVQQLQPLHQEAAQLGESAPAATTATAAPLPTTGTSTTSSAQAQQEPSSSSSSSSAHQPQPSILHQQGQQLPTTTTSGQAATTTSRKRRQTNTCRRGSCSDEDEQNQSEEGERDEQEEQENVEPDVVVVDTPQVEFIEADMGRSSTSDEELEKSVAEALEISVVELEEGLAQGEAWAEEARAAGYAEFIEQDLTRSRSEEELEISVVADIEEYMARHGRAWAEASRTAVVEADIAAERQEERRVAAAVQHLLPEGTTSMPEHQTTNPPPRPPTVHPAPTAQEIVAARDANATSAAPDHDDDHAGTATRTDEDDMSHEIEPPSASSTTSSRIYSAPSSASTAASTTTLVLQQQLPTVPEEEDEEEENVLPNVEQRQDLPQLPTRNFTQLEISLWEDRKALAMLIDCRKVDKRHSVEFERHYMTLWHAALGDDPEDPRTYEEVLECQRFHGGVMNLATFDKEVMFRLWPDLPEKLKQRAQDMIDTVPWNAGYVKIFYSCLTSVLLRNDKNMFGDDGEIGALMAQAVVKHINLVGEKYCPDILAALQKHNNDVLHPTVLGLLMGFSHFDENLMRNPKLDDNAARQGYDVACGEEAYLSDLFNDVVDTAPRYFAYPTFHEITQLMLQGRPSLKDELVHKTEERSKEYEVEAVERPQDVEHPPEEGPASPSPQEPVPEDVLGSPQTPAPPQEPVPPEPATTLQEPAAEQAGSTPHEDQQSAPPAPSAVVQGDEANETCRAETTVETRPSNTELLLPPEVRTAADEDCSSAATDHKDEAVELHDDPPYPTLRGLFGSSQPFGDVWEGCLAEHISLYPKGNMLLHTQPLGKATSICPMTPSVPLAIQMGSQAFATMLAQKMREEQEGRTGGSGNANASASQINTTSIKTTAKTITEEQLRMKIQIFDNLTQEHCGMLQDAVKDPKKKPFKYCRALGWRAGEYYRLDHDWQPTKRNAKSCPADYRELPSYKLKMEARQALRRADRLQREEKKKERQERRERSAAGGAQHGSFTSSSHSSCVEAFERKKHNKRKNLRRKNKRETNRRWCEEREDNESRDENISQEGRFSSSANDADDDAGSSRSGNGSPSRCRVRNSRTSRSSLSSRTPSRARSQVKWKRSRVKRVNRAGQQKNRAHDRSFSYGNESYNSCDSEDSRKKHRRGRSAAAVVVPYEEEEEVDTSGRYSSYRRRKAEDNNSHVDEDQCSADRSSSCRSRRSGSVESGRSSSRFAASSVGSGHSSRAAPSSSGSRRASRSCRSRSEASSFEPPRGRSPGRRGVRSSGSNFQQSGGGSDKRGQEESGPRRECSQRKSNRSSRSMSSSRSSRAGSYNGAEPDDDNPRPPQSRPRRNLRQKFWKNKSRKQGRREEGRRSGGSCNEPVLVEQQEDLLPPRRTNKRRRKRRDTYRESDNDVRIVSPVEEHQAGDEKNDAENNEDKADEQGPGTTAGDERRSPTHNDRNGSSAQVSNVPRSSTLRSSRRCSGTTLENTSRGAGRNGHLPPEQQQTRSPSAAVEDRDELQPDLVLPLADERTTVGVVSPPVRDETNAENRSKPAEDDKEEDLQEASAAISITSQEHGHANGTATAQRQAEIITPLSRRVLLPAGATTGAIHTGASSTMTPSPTSAVVGPLLGTTTQSRTSPTNVFGLVPSLNIDTTISTRELFSAAPPPGVNSAGPFSVRTSQPDAITSSTTEAKTGARSCADVATASAAGGPAASSAAKVDDDATNVLVDSNSTASRQTASAPSTAMNEASANTATSSNTTETAPNDEGGHDTTVPHPARPPTTDEAAAVVAPAPSSSTSTATANNNIATNPVVVDTRTTASASGPQVQAPQPPSQKLATYFDSPNYAPGSALDRSPARSPSNRTSCSRNVSRRPANNLGTTSVTAAAAASTATSRTSTSTGAGTAAAAPAPVSCNIFAPLSKTTFPNTSIFGPPGSTSLSSLTGSCNTGVVTRGPVTSSNSGALPSSVYPRPMISTTTAAPTTRPAGSTTTRGAPTAATALPAGSSMAQPPRPANPNASNVVLANNANAPAVVLSSPGVVGGPSTGNSRNAAAGAASSSSSTCTSVAGQLQTAGTTNNCSKNGNNSTSSETQRSRPQEPRQNSSSASAGPLSQAAILHAKYGTNLPEIPPFRGGRNRGNCNGPPNCSIMTSTTTRVQPAGSSSTASSSGINSNSFNDMINDQRNNYAQAPAYPRFPNLRVEPRVLARDRRLEEQMAQVQKAQERFAKESTASSSSSSSSSSTNASGPNEQDNHRSSNNSGGGAASRASGEAAQNLNRN